MTKTALWICVCLAGVVVLVFWAWSNEYTAHSRACGWATSDQWRASCEAEYEANGLIGARSVHADYRAVTGH